jgi:hypothetical protein
MEEECPSGSDAILGDLLTQVIAEKQSDIICAIKFRKRDEQSVDLSSSVTTHKWVDDDSESENTEANDYITKHQPAQVSVQNTEYATESMLKKFIDDQDATMMARKKSLDTLNNMIYVQDDSDQEM